MGASDVHAGVTGLNRVALVMPTSREMCPPSTSTLPSAITYCPAQNRVASGKGTAVKVPVPGSQILAPLGSSVWSDHTSTLPVCKRTACTSTSGHVMTEDHCPTWSGVGGVSTVDARLSASSLRPTSEADPVTLPPL